MACSGCGYSNSNSGRESYSPLSSAESPSPGASYSHRQKYDSMSSSVSDSISGIKYDSSSVKYNSNSDNNNPSGNYSSLLSPGLDYEITKITEAEKSKSETQEEQETSNSNTPSPNPSNQNTSLQRIDTPPNSGELITTQPDQQIIEFLQNNQLADRDNNLPVKHASLTQLEIQEEITLIRKRKIVKKSLSF
tara:strand:+ start:10831 stop:11406 length:576 start_codon:yes stop_codon:yes gene_type:complete